MPACVSIPTVAGGALLAASLLACGPRENPRADSAAAATIGAATATDTAVVTTAVATDNALLVDVDTVVVFAGRGLASIAPATAVAVIRRIEDRLDATNVEPLDEIATDLESLREELDDDTIDGADVANILARLSTKVTAVANNAQIAGSAAPALTRLGAALAQGAQTLRAR